MIKKTISFKGYDGEEYTEDFFFQLTKTDLIDWAAEEEGILEKLKAITKTDDPLKVVPVVKTIIERSYGKKIGRSFVKTKEILYDFIYTEAFDDLYMELSTDAEKLIEFVEGIMPKLDESAQKEIAEARRKFEEEQKNRANE